MSPAVQFSETDSHCLLRMDDGKANALSFDLLAALQAALDRAEASGRVVVLTGREGRFCAGFDLAVMARADSGTLELLRQGVDLARRLLAFPAPVILAASGHALAMGGLLLLSADYRVGADGAFKVGLNEVAIGMTLPWFGVELARARLATNHLERAVGLAQVYDPAGAVAAGFLDEVVAPAQLLDRAAALAAQFAQLDMVAHRNSKARTRAPLTTALAAAFERDFSG